MKRFFCAVLALMTMLTAVCGAAAESKTEERLSEAAASGVTASEANVSDPETQWTNILLIGSDERRERENGGRSDALMVCAVHNESGQVKLLSLARDMWVKLPDRSFEDKINTAYRYGGPELSMRVVGETLELDITQYIAINFYGFCDVVDMLGGVEIELMPNEAGAINQKTSETYGNTKVTPIPAGAKSAVLNGAQALGYARIRRLDNDFGRTQRQRNVLTAILKKVLTLSFTEQLQFVKACLACVDTNLSLEELLSLGGRILAHGMDDLEQAVVPGAGHYNYATKDGKSTVTFRPEVVIEEAHAFIYGLDAE